jgi:pyruvate-formate lyase-activating enzyme
LEINVEVTGHCNHRCVFCPQTTMARAKGHMAPELFERIVKQAAGWAELALLHLGGEPLLHPQIGELLAIARAHRLPTLLSTNAGVLDAQRRAVLRQHPPDILVFSLDATDAATYRQLGRTGSFAATTSFVREFLREKPALGLPLTVVQLILMKENAHQAAEFARIWSQAGADVVRIKPYFDFPGLDSYHGIGSPDRGRGCCIYLWRQLAVLWDGRVVSCCLDMEGVTDMGDAAQTPLTTIWNGSALQRLRHIHASGRAGEVAPCATCTMPTLAPWQLAGALALDAHTIKTLLPRYERLIAKLPQLGYFSARRR